MYQNGKEFVVSVILTPVLNIHLIAERYRVINSSTKFLPVLERSSLRFQVLYVTHSLPYGVA